MPTQDRQLAILAWFVGLLSIGCCLYIWLAQPESLRSSRNGVPFFLPEVIQPDTGNAVTIDELVEHFKQANE